MLRETLDRLITDHFHTQAEFLFENEKEAAVYRHPLGKKWFALVMVIPHAKLDAAGGMAVILNLKLDPDLIETLLGQKGFYPAYHMNKRHWITLDLSCFEDESLVLQLLSMSHRLTKTTQDP